jgi:hypothetical protein
MNNQLGGSFMEQDFDTLTHLGSKFTFAPNLQGGSGMIMHSSMQLLTVGGLPAGTGVVLNFVSQISGTYNDSVAQSAALFGSGQGLVLDVLPAIYGFSLQHSSLGGSMRGFTVFSGPPGTSSNGSFSQQFSSGPISVTAGNPFTLESDLSFSLNSSGNASLMADFLDPFSIVNVVATDPSSGALLSGITLTSDAGVSFPVNSAGPAPEPKSALLVLCCVALALLRRRVSTRTLSKIGSPA